MYQKLVSSPAELYRGFLSFLRQGVRSENNRRAIDLAGFVITESVHMEFGKYFPVGVSPFDVITETASRMINLRDSTEPVGLALATLGEENTLVEHPFFQGSKEKQFFDFEVHQQVPPEKLEKTEWRTLPLKRSHDEGVNRTIFCKASMVALSDQIVPLNEALAGRVDYVTTRPFTSMDLVSLAQKVTPTDSQELVAIIEMHAQFSEVQFFGEGTYFRRVLPYGTESLVENIAKAVGCTKDESANFLTSSRSGETMHPAVAAEFLTLGEQFERKVNQSFAFISTLMRGTAVQKVIIVGQPLHTTGIAARLKSQLPQEVVYGSGAFGFDGFVTGGENLPITHPDSYHAFVAGVQRLGFGLHRANFLPHGKPFEPDADAAWGVSIGTTGLTAVRVTRKV